MGLEEVKFLDNGQALAGFAVRAWIWNYPNARKFE